MFLTLKNPHSFNDEKAKIYHFLIKGRVKTRLLDIQPHRQGLK